MNNVVQHPSTDYYSKGLAMGAIAACITTAGKNIIQYAQDLSLLLHQLILSPYRAESAALWSESCQALGKLASSVLKDNQS